MKRIKTAWRWIASEYLNVNVGVGWIIVKKHCPWYRGNPERTLTLTASWILRCCVFLRWSAKLLIKFLKKSVYNSHCLGSYLSPKHLQWNILYQIRINGVRVILSEAKNLSFKYEMLHFVQHDIQALINWIWYYFGRVRYLHYSFINRDR